MTHCTHFSEKSIGDGVSGGSGNMPDYRFDDADLIVSIDADFLGSWPFAEVYTKQFMSGRNPDNKKMNRLLVVESNLSLTRIERRLSPHYRSRFRNHSWPGTS